VQDYYETFERECEPIGWAPNPNVAMVTGFSCHRDGDEARRRGLDGFRFFGFALGHYYLFGSHKPGRTNIWESFEGVRNMMPDMPAGGIGTPDDLRVHLRKFQDVGVDQVIFIQQGGKNRHQHICESLELFASDVMPEFQAGEAERERAKAARLAPAIAAAMRRKKYLRAPSDEEIAVFNAYGRTIIDPASTQGQGAGLAIPREHPGAG
jgi:hypothetical protein